MQRPNKVFLVSVLVLLVPLTVEAQSVRPSFGLGIGATELDEASDLFVDFSGGGALEGSLFLATSYLHVILTESRGTNNDEFFFDKGVDRCRERATGQFAKDTECAGDPKAFIGISVDAVYKIPTSKVFFGLGGRAGTPSTIYITGGAFLRNQRTQIKGYVSTSFASLDIVFTLAR